MTKQEPEILCENEKQYQMLNYPLNEYFLIHGAPPLKFQKTSLRRGYIGTWRIQDKKLWLEDIKGNLENDTKFKIEEFFGKEPPIHANWFNGPIYLELGKLIRVQGSFNPIYEQREKINIKNGSISNREIQYYDKKTGEFIQK
ncbi:MAG: hypothetical protein INQ03_16410 [Candidatus Heimdallarchaeota archaeon]|nr:hypothetical protein [Candidatus Heimdallarchaeota archaeon]